MDKTIIGINAGKIWRLLSNNARWSFEELKIKSGLNDIDLSAAIGWLAREDKVEFETDLRDFYVYLNVNVYIG